MKLFLLFFVLHVIHCNAEITEEDGILVLTKDNFDEAIKRHDYILVEFYAPWCGHCKSLAPKFVEAAEKLKKEGSQVKLAKVDTTVEVDLGQRYEIKGYPTLKYFKKQSPIEFKGIREVDDIVSFCKRKMLPSVQIIESVSQFKELSTSSKFLLVAFTKDKNDELTTALEKHADELDDVTFTITTDPELLSLHKVKSQSFIFFKHDDEPAEYTEDTIDNLPAFVRTEMVPLVTDFSHESASIVFSSPIQKHIIVFVIKDDGYEQLKKGLTEVAKKFKRKLHVMIVDANVEDHNRILEFFSIEKSAVPTYRIVELGDEVVKYKPDSSDLSVSSISTFADDVLNNKVKRFMMSEEIPTDNAGSVRVLVGKNFKDVCLDDTKVVIVKIYTPWCGHCKALAPIWEQLGEAYKNSNDVIVAKMDATANEVEGLKINGFPTILFYPKNAKAPITYEGERTLEDLKKFIDSSAVTEQSKPTTKDEL